MGKLAIFLGSLPVLAVEIGEKTTRLGRSTQNDIVLPLPDVADFHAEMFATGDRCEIRALARESVRSQGRPVARAILSSGEHVALGGYHLQWLTGDSDQGPSASVADLVSARAHGTKPLEAASERLPRATGVEVLEGEEQGSAIELVAAVTMVGRSLDCDLVLTDAAASWRHCSLELTREGVRVRDLDSHNGTFLDGRRIESALAGAGAKIQIGETTLRLTGETEPGAPEATSGLAELVGGSSPMLELYGLIREAAASRLPVFISGETGTGKELVARAIHSLGLRSAGPFVPVNCAAIPREMLEDELFGHVKGAFTGATSDRPGALERANAGTVFLDEVGELALDLQAKLLRVLEDQEIPRLGGDSVQGDFRVVAATNRDLDEAATDEKFRQDLYFRLAVLQIRVPPLRDRLEDLPDLTRHFLDQAEVREGIPGAADVALGHQAMDRLRQHTWPGNVRELKNLVLRALVAAKGGPVGLELVDRLLSESVLRPADRAAAATSLEEMEQEAIRKALQDCNGQRRAAARRLGIAESTLYDKIRKYGLAEVGQ
jgi:DNA-binding NtrC family response regulator